MHGGNISYTTIIAKITAYPKRVVINYVNLIYLEVKKPLSQLNFHLRMLLFFVEKFRFSKT